MTKTMAMPGTRTAVTDLCACSGWLTREDQDPSTQAYERSPTRDKLECGCEVHAQGTHRRARVYANNTIEKGEQTGTWVRQVARAMEEQLRKDQQERNTQEQKRKAEDAKRIRGIVHENNNSKGTSHVQDEMEKFVHHDEQELLSLWEGWHWDDNTGGWLDPEHCTEARREEVEYTRVTGRCADVRRERHPS